MHKARGLVNATISNIKSQLQEVDRMRTKPGTGKNQTQGLYSASIAKPQDVISFSGSPDLLSSNFKALRDRLIWQDPSRTFAIKQFADLAGQEAAMQSVWSVEALKDIDLNISTQVFAEAQRRIEGIPHDSQLKEKQKLSETIKFLKLQHESVGYLLSAQLHRQVKQMEYWGLTELTTQLWQVDDTIFMLFKSQPPILAGIWASCNSTGSRSKL